MTPEELVYYRCLAKNPSIIGQHIAKLIAYIDELEEKIMEAGGGE